MNAKQCKRLRRQVREHGADGLPPTAYEVQGKQIKLAGCKRWIYKRLKKENRNGQTARDLSQQLR